MCTVDVVGMVIVTGNTYQNWGHKHNIFHEYKSAVTPVEGNKTSFYSCNHFVQLQWIPSEVPLFE